MISDVHSFLHKLHESALQQGFTSHDLYETGGYQVRGYTRAGVGEKAIYLSSGMHGDEPAGPLAVAELLVSGCLSEDIHWAVVPVINPVGLAAGTRENGEGLDMNRDFLQCQSHEVRHLIAWLREQRLPQMMLSLHEDWESKGFYFYEINIEQDQPERAHQLREAAEQTMVVEPQLVIDDHLVREPGWIYHEAEADEPTGWPEAIFMADLGCLVSFTMETPTSLDIEQRVATHIGFVRAAQAVV